MCRQQLFIARGGPVLQRDMLSALCATVRSFTLEDAIEILSRVNKQYLNCTMYVENQNSDCRAITFKSLGNDPRNLGTHLTSFWMVWYKCGPPNRREWVEGTICQFVADCLLLEVAARSEEIVCDIVADVIKLGAP